MPMRPRLLLVALLAAAAAGCGGESYSHADYWAIVPDLVRFADADARTNAGGKRPEGPLLIDVKSFAGGAWQLTGTTVPRDSVMPHVAAAVPGAEGVAQPQDAFMIQDTGTVEATREAAAGLYGGRWVKGYGVLLHLNLVKADASEIAVTVTSYATDRRNWPTGICRRIQRVTYRKAQNGAWQRTGAQLRKGCDDPD